MAWLPVFNDSVLNWPMPFTTCTVPKGELPSKKVTDPAGVLLDGAMACTVAVEDVIDEHYQTQIERLDKTDPELKDAISRFRKDECAHRDEALAHGAAERLDRVGAAHAAA